MLELLRQRYPAKVLQLISTKCMPILQYGLEAFSLYNYRLKSLDFVINKFFIKLFRTLNMHVVSDCQEQFNFVLPSVLLVRRAEKFVNKLHVDYVYLSLFLCVFGCYQFLVNKRFIYYQTSASGRIITDCWRCYLRTFTPHRVVHRDTQ